IVADRPSAYQWIYETHNCGRRTDARNPRRIVMPANCSDAEEIGALLVTFAADLTDAAYSVALRHGIAGSWIDLQLEVWRAIARRVAGVAPESLSSPGAGELDSVADAFLAELTQVAHGIVLRYGLLGSFLDFELDLHQSLRRVMELWQSAGRLQ